MARRGGGLGRRPAGGRGVGASLGLVAVSLVMGFSPAATAATAPAVHAAPPYAILTPLLFPDFTSNGTQSRSWFVIAPSLNSTTGAVRLSERAYSEHSSVGFDWGLAFATAGFRGANFTVPASRTYSLSFDWNVSYNASLAARGPQSALTAFASIFALGYVVDTTNGSLLTGSGGSAVVLFHEIHAGAWSSGAKGTRVQLEFNVSLATGSVYYVATVLECYATAQSTAAGTSRAGLNLGTGGDRALLSSVTLIG